MPNVTLNLKTPGWDEADERLQTIMALFSGDTSAAFDLTAAAEEIAEMMVEENREARMAGLDKDGVPLIPVTESTERRRKRRGDGDGMPMAPNFGYSSTISGFHTRVERVSPWSWVVVGEWNMPWLYSHREPLLMGDKNQIIRPTRDIVGHTPASRIRAREIFHRHVEALLSGRR